MSGPKTASGGTQNRRTGKDPLGVWPRPHAAEAVRQNILKVAQDEFVAKGFHGASVNEIAMKTATTKRMMYYYYGDKEGMYKAVLESAYLKIRTDEISLDLEALSPTDALREVVIFTFDYHAAHREFVKLVMIENLNNAEYIKKIERIEIVNSSALKVLGDVYSRGVDVGVFKIGISIIDLHMTISALSFYNVSNQATVRHVFGYDMANPDVHAERRQVVVDTVLSYVKA